ncbi:hypothetical protein ACLK1S_00390 [Escherichia coli]
MSDVEADAESGWYAYRAGRCTAVPELFAGILYACDNAAQSGRYGLSARQQTSCGLLNTSLLIKENFTQGYAGTLQYPGSTG